MCVVGTGTKGKRRKVGKISETERLYDSSVLVGTSRQKGGLHGLYYYVV